MECNRDEALRAKEVSERKFLSQDIKGARKFALKAQNLNPELEGISQLVATLEVYNCAEEEKIHGEPNWYGVLGVTPLADEDMIRRQYRKLALLLHPDKNISVGAEGAFKLISQAWGVMSDKSKKIAYDQRCGARRTQAKNASPSPMPSQSGFHDFANSAAAQMKATKSSKKNPSSGSHSSRKKERNTFWTVCHWCKMQYEYLRMYLNHNLLCPNCKEAYFAVEISPPSTKGTRISSEMKNKSATHPGASRSNQSNENNDFQWIPFTELDGVRSAARAANMVQKAYEKIKRDRQKAQAAARKEAMSQKKTLASKRVFGAESSGHANIAKRRKVGEDGSTVNVNGEGGIQRNADMSSLKQDSLRKCMITVDGVCQVDSRQLLLFKARDEISKKLNNGISATTGTKVTAGENLENTTEKQTKNLIDDSTEHSFVYQNKLSRLEETNDQLPLHKLDAESSGRCPEVKLVEQIPRSVIGSDFHDFDKERAEECFQNNQVWAIYDDDDGMPRLYALIHNVMSLNPFKVRMSLLNSLTHHGPGYVNWFLNGFSKTCGKFGIGKAVICSSVDAFSHRVQWMDRTSKTFQIFPQEGDVWALYRNWSLEWNEVTEDEVIHKYDIIEVLEDYDKEMGVIIIPLVKVAGFNAVFHRHMDPMEIKRIPNEEMSRFSHQVPSRVLTDQEGLKLLKGCRELDPAAIPDEIICTISDVDRIEFTESDDDLIDENTVPKIVEEVPDTERVECC